MAWMMLAMWFGAALPVWAVWTSAAWQVVGGGASVMIAMIYSMIADVEPPEMRANAFYLTVVGTLVGNLVAVPISAHLMQRSPWIPRRLRGSTSTARVCEALQAVLRGLRWMEF
ncbi:hypothetical protein HIM_06231 [Hirsutella minnesotensis 3608]|uniref:Major facilitator superfamily (MFS) profile domain-containing protein n=1 Tax=Hirsutella minnesotensis 3608 TaxID=1043627 RepID=A0A0F7ZJH6_9HYPO|nr:hypothetical protein HIM_06231 [Hirsutella minnesotensis 3608]